MALAGQRTLLVIAHRLTAVKRCDKVLFFDSGRLVAEGDYDTLRVESEPVRRFIQAGEI
jgi:ABC-type multidrug transport system fused ATPase/permease subunit